jgi:non-lysosomal glucosylceramidase
MWNSTLGFFRAYTGGNAIMSDCLYGQQVALAHGLGWLLPKNLISQHLAAEALYNANAFGLTVVKGRNEPLVSESVIVSSGDDSVAQRKTARAGEVRALMQRLRARGDGQDDSVWMGSGPTWSCLAWALGADGPAGGNITAALEPSRWILSNYRDRLRMMWDLTGLSTTADWGGDNNNGQPFCTSHYGFMLTDYYLMYALSGQLTNIPNGTLSFAPLYSAPYTVPWALMGKEGTLTVSASGTRTFALAFGTLALPAGGLSVSGVAYPGAVDLGPGQSVSW